jgi:hypothetical protein
MPTLKKLTTILIVDAIEPQLPLWETLGYRVTVRVPESGRAGFVMLQGAAGELMLQTHDSLAEDLPDVARRKPIHMLYADVDSLTKTKRALPQAEVIVASRKTFYGAHESWLALPDGVILGLSEHAG